MKTLRAVCLDEPLPQLSSTPEAVVDPCSSWAGGSGGSGGGTTTPAGTEADLNACDNSCAVDGLYCVPDVDSAFYQCLNGVRYGLQYCQSGLIFNDNVKSCDWPANHVPCQCQPNEKREVKRLNRVFQHNPSPIRINHYLKRISDMLYGGLRNN